MVLIKGRNETRTIFNERAKLLSESIHELSGG